ncbi:type II toxin-antitoxin system RelB/DinJ family antitoxin [Weissella tructae]|uniref:RelB/DinJ family protein addiction moduleantitoxin n=2 Tax=Weissella TaxID=46255 RepID=A0A075TYV2_9LACO|nr:MULTISPECIES: type II toxin-antitoxin system RelB/DinJ family antitoxin [Weissella]AIG65481.1 RelB/DinJ family protein addiction moduleantitoxin [Weissella tructae]AIM62795.1 RelB/DinJ family protein addiction moduleantitoxin [Weissella ceti]AIM64130.1 RelB/DinJ family protein addiction moduleantitoxin [Weissella ceti]ELA07060.1 RelB/DinJ family protein addiction module antitoxin [Weissella ceti NC36]QVV91854.1 type II toxin-antitoxin system RelB/DinJ family antitoxin [Weissella tructae]
MTKKTETTEKLLQVRVEDTVTDRCDKLFAARGITTQNAIRMLLAQVANSGETPFDNLFTSK